MEPYCLPHAIKNKTLSSQNKDKLTGPSCSCKKTKKGISGCSVFHLALVVGEVPWQSKVCQGNKHMHQRVSRWLFSHCKNNVISPEDVWRTHLNYEWREVNYGWREGRLNALDICLQHMVGYTAMDPLQTPWQVTSQRDSVISSSVQIIVGLCPMWMHST